MDILGTGHFLRSAEMEYVSLIIAEHLAHDVVGRLGEVGVLQFTDMNGDMTAFKRHYTPYIRRCDDLEKKLKFFEDEMAKHGIVPEQYTAAEFATWSANQRDTLSREHRGLSLLDYWESIINERHRDYVAIKTERDGTAASLYQAVQRRLVIDHAKNFFLEAASGGFGSDVTSPPAGAAGTEPGARGASAAAGVGFGGASGGQVPRLVGAAAVLALDSERGAGSPAALTSRGAEAAATEADGMTFKHLAGIIATDDKVRFARIVFRASAGHAVVRFADVYEPLLDETGAEHVKSVFTIFYRGRTLSTKLDRICSAFGAHQHDIPSFTHAGAVREALDETRRVMEDTMTWLRQEGETSTTTLRHLGLLIRKWRTGVQREKAVYFALNMFTRQPERGTVSVHAWVLKTAVPQCHDTIQEAHAAAAQGGRMQPYYIEVLREGAGGAPLPQPPTHFAINKVTRVFQGIVNTYGVPRYGEANPALFSIVTFPFLFGVMYGDIGHAIFLTLASAFLLYREEYFLKQRLGEMFSMAFKGRYMLFFMGIFSIYCGLMYNDFFSIATSAFGGSRWVFPVQTSNTTTTNNTVIITTLSAYAAKSTGSWDDVYAFGVDPIWHTADNDLLFFNSLKMKMSVIFGITQMTFGLLLKLSNAVHFNSKADLFFEAIPQLIFMVALFGYMVFLIILKWCINWQDPASRPGAPPSLIDTLINVALKPGFIQDGMFGGQASLQVIILLVVFITVPVMLLGKPLAAHFAQKDRARRHEERNPLIAAAATPAPAAAAFAGSSGGGAAADGDQLVVADASAAAAASAPAADGHGHHHGAAGAGGHHAEGGGSGGGDPHGHEESHGFGDVFIHQAIETIEFVLGSVSNTASYLRLWALSLAHSQLASVFWERALASQIETGGTLGPVMIFVGYGAFAMVTMGVLLLMDVLECFLHALRLHWVEFQNKFYKADGYKFLPFSFAALAEAAADAD